MAGMHIVCGGGGVKRGWYNLEEVKPCPYRRLARWHVAITRADHVKHVIQAHAECTGHGCDDSKI